MLSLLGARGLAVGYREVHCCCSDEGGRSARRQPVNRQPPTHSLPSPSSHRGRGRARPKLPPPSDSSRLPWATNAGSEFAIATEHRTAMNHAPDIATMLVELHSAALLWTMYSNFDARAVYALRETRAALHHRRFSLPCQRSEPACCSGHCPPLRLQVTASKQASEAGAAWRAPKPRCNTRRLLSPCHDTTRLEHAFAAHCQPVLSLCSSMDHLHSS